MYYGFYLFTERFKILRVYRKVVQRPQEGLERVSHCMFFKGQKHRFTFEVACEYRIRRSACGVKERAYMD